MTVAAKVYGSRGTRASAHQDVGGSAGAKTASIKSSSDVGAKASRSAREPSAPSTPSRKRRHDGTANTPLTPQSQILSPFGGSPASPSPSKRAVDLDHVFRAAISKSGQSTPSTKDGATEAHARLVERMTSSPTSQRVLPVDQEDSARAYSLGSKSVEDDVVLDIFAPVPSSTKLEASCTSVRNYGGMRTYLAGSSSRLEQLKGADDTVKAPDVVPTYRDVAAQLSQSQSSRVSMDPDTEVSEDENVHNLAVLRENGDLRKFQDDLDYLLDGVEPTANMHETSPDTAEAWQSQISEILVKLKDPEFVRLLRLTGSSPRLLGTCLPPISRKCELPENTVIQMGRIFLHMLRILEMSEPITVKHWLESSQESPAQLSPARLVSCLLMNDAQDLLHASGPKAAIWTTPGRAAKDILSHVSLHIHLVSRLVASNVNWLDEFLKDYFAKFSSLIIQVSILELENASHLTETVSEFAQSLYARAVETLWTKDKDLRVWDHFDTLLRAFLRRGSIEGTDIYLQILQNTLGALLRLSAWCHDKAVDTSGCLAVLTSLVTIGQKLSDQITDPVLFESVFAVLSNLVEILASYEVDLPSSLFTWLSDFWSRIEQTQATNREDNPESWRRCRCTLAVLMANIGISSRHSFVQLKQTGLDAAHIVAALQEHGMSMSNADLEALPSELRTAEKTLGSHLLVKEMQSAILAYA